MIARLAQHIVPLILMEAAAFGQGGIALAGTGYSNPPPLSVAPGQIITLRLTGLKTMLPANAPVQRATSVPLPKALAGISATVAQTAPALTEQLPLFAVQQFNQCGGAGSNVQSPDCVLTALTVQIPFDITVPDPKTGPSAGQSTAISIQEAGASSMSFGVQAVRVNPHILTSCDLVVGNSATSCDPIVTHADGSPITFANQARINEILVMYAVGLGVTVPPVVAGDASPLAPPYPLVYGGAAVAPDYDVAQFPTEPGASIGIIFSGLAPGLVGVYQVNFKVYGPFDTYWTCSLVGPNLTFELDVVLPSSPPPTDHATLCVDTTEPAVGNGVAGASNGVPVATRIPKVLRDAFGPGPNRNSR